MGVEASDMGRWREATNAFGGDLNAHTFGAQRQMRELAVARLVDDDL